MDFFTSIEIPDPVVRISYQDQIMLFGSCFAESMGNRLSEHKFNVDVNPFGVLYNPLSISKAIHALLSPALKTKDDLFFHNGLFHSFTHHSNFSATSADVCIEKINNRMNKAVAHLEKTRYLLITFGTAYAYRLKSKGEIAANCHKLPAGLFDHKRLTISEIVDAWSQLLSILFRQNKQLHVIFTVSPIRYRKYGAHGNQISKSILLLAIEEIQRLFPVQTGYFPAYEFMLDELRDYRFYAEDMLHPSETAIQYIWERFTETYLDQSAQQLLTEIKDILKSIHHKPFNPESESYKQFVIQTLLKIELLMKKRPYLCFEREIKRLKNNLSE
ncbi:MAG: GSCFA domain-containing protein [Tannerella sp.]|jgi:hypothetical protein|nr:GSCFA domain-containing protein [Tannerella sp.]